MGELLSHATVHCHGDIDPLRTILLGLCFGGGAVIVPALAFGADMAYFGQRVRQIMYSERTSLERASTILRRLG